MCYYVRIRLRRPIYPWPFVLLTPARGFVLGTSEDLSCFLLCDILKRCCCSSRGERSGRPFPGERVLHTAARFCSRNGRCCLTCLSFACRRGNQDRSLLSIWPSEVCLDIDRPSGERCWSTPGANHSCSSTATKRGSVLILHCSNLACFSE